MLLKREDIRQQVEQLQKQRSERLCVKADFVMQQTLDLLQKCMAATPKTQWDYEQRKMVEVGQYQLDSKGACRCLELLAKMTGADQKRETVEDGPVFYHGEEGIRE